MYKKSLKKSSAKKAVETPTDKGENVSEETPEKKSTSYARWALVGIGAVAVGTYAYMRYQKNKWDWKIQVNRYYYLKKKDAY